MSKNFRVDRGPFVTPHAVEEFKKHIYNCDSPQAVDLILKGFYNGKQVFNEHRTRMVQAKFPYDVEGVIVATTRQSGSDIIKTILTLKEFYSNTKKRGRTP